MSAPTRPLVSVLIPAYNAELTIERALRSAWSQSYRPLEIVVVNDASRDRTADVVTSLAMPEVKLFSLEENRGECGAMNFGLQQARGEFVAFLDADDEWLDDKIGKQVSLLEANTGMNFVSCGCLFVSDVGPPPYEFGLSLAAVKPNEVWRLLLAATHVAKPCVVARRSALDRVGPFDPALMVAGDQDMWIRLASTGDVGVVPEVLVRAYDTPHSLTKKYATRMAEFVLPMVERHVTALSDRLTRDDVNRIWGERYSTVGRNLYLTGDYLRGILFLLKAMVRGRYVAGNLWYIITASPTARWMKTTLASQQRT